MKSIDVVAAIIGQDGKVLATQRGYGEQAGGWEFPGGKIELGETPEEAILREIHEELGAIIAVDGHLVTIDHDYETFHLHMACFLAHVAEGALELHEHSSARWVDSETIDSLDWLPADLKVVKAVKEQGFIRRRATI